MAAIAFILLQSADILKAVQAPQQNPATTNESLPWLLMQADSLSYLLLISGIFCSLTVAMSLGMSSMGPLQGGSSSSGRYTRKPNAAQVSATVLCRPLSMPKMSQMSTKCLFPEPTSQSDTPSRVTSLPSGEQLSWRAGQDPGGQHPCPPAWPEFTHPISFLNYYSA